MNNTINLINSYLSSNDNFEDILIESIYNSIDNISYSLLETVSIIDMGIWEPLIESVDEIKNTEKQIKELSKEKDDEKKETLFKKLIESLKKIYLWWYKIEPNKKYKTLHIILHILLKVLVIYITYSNFGKLKMAATINSKIPSKLIYNGSNKLLKSLFGENRIGLNIIKSIFAGITDVLKRLNDNITKNINMKDIDKSISECEKIIETVDNKISDAYDRKEFNELIKCKNNAEITLSQLTKLKDRNLKGDK